eukprot:TRINITY_DN3157_c0_g1_i1.p1 TRINITY_DN3157_c0_g1~~TRINITY_DN3157_c0_g1_i1.p1  ORF type:complete len:588 (+),score=132.61 TRINITY_DN3157_c0_g1_i1:47-1765(+)
MEVASIQVRQHSNARGGKYSIIVSRTYDEMSERVALCVGTRLIETPSAVVALTVGATPVGSYKHLAALASKGTVDLSSTHFLLLDEFYPSDAKSRRSGDEATIRRRTKEDNTIAPHLKELQETFFQAAKIPEEHIHSPNPYLTPTQAAATYSEVSQLRRLDVAILHCGTRGNIGWITNPGGGESTQEFAFVRDMTEASSQENRNFHWCVSLGLATLMQAKELIVLAVGKNKAEIIKNVLEDVSRGKSSSNVLCWLLQNHPRVSIHLDSPAASFVPELNASLRTSFSVRGFKIINDPNTIKNKRIVCFSPHPDDTSISAGATLAFLSLNNSITSVVATTGHRAYIPNTTPEERIRIREEEALEEARLLGAQVKYLHLPLYNRGSTVGEDDVSIVFEYLSRFKPHMIFLPHTGDAHPTHRAVVRTILLSLLELFKTKTPLKSLQDSSSSPQEEEDNTYCRELYMYEGPWSLFGKGCYNTVCSPEPERFAQKMAAIRAHKSQTGRTPYDRAGDALALLRGALVPEQDLSGFGEEPPSLQDRVELFYHIQINSIDDLQKLFRWLDAQQPPIASSSS